MSDWKDVARTFGWNPHTCYDGSHRTMAEEVMRLRAEIIEWKDRHESLKESKIALRLSELKALREALEKYGLPCAVWYCHGPYGPSPDQESTQKIREALELMPVPSALPKESE